MMNAHHARFCYFAEPLREKRRNTITFFQNNFLLPEYLFIIKSEYVRERLPHFPN